MPKKDTAWKVVVSCTTPRDIKADLVRIAEYENNTVSRLADRIIRDWILSQRATHPALLTQPKTGQTQL
jgi:hypothetical protein